MSSAFTVIPMTINSPAAAVVNRNPLVRQEEIEEPHKRRLHNYRGYKYSTVSVPKISITSVDVDADAETDDNHK